MMQSLRGGFGFHRHSLVLIRFEPPYLRAKHQICTYVRPTLYPTKKKGKKEKEGAHEFRVSLIHTSKLQMLVSRT